MKALSVRQPWAWAILYAGKGIENRDWLADGCRGMREVRGRVLLHASKTCTRAEYAYAAEFIEDICGLKVPPLAELPRGAIVGAMTIADVTDHSDSPWFVGPLGLVLVDAKPAPRIVPCVGKLGYFRVPDDVAVELRKAA